MIELKLNKYINAIMKFYDNVVVNPEKPKYEKVKKFPFQEEIVISYPERNKILKEIGDLEKNTIVPTGMEFNDLWEFCQFVKFAEKTLFYRNDPKRLFYVDSDLNDLEKRQFVITDFDHTYQLLFKLEKTNDSFSHDIIRVIRLSVSREYGRKMTNEFIIVNSDIKYNDDADIYLIDNINRILCERISCTFDEILNLTKKNKED